jgi:two-component system, NtrC family, response regulator GlrR
VTAQPDILLVDDDEDLLKLISMRLGAAGYKVETAAGGEQALAAIGAARPRLVITDLRMDGMDGMALFEAIRRADHALPVIVLTAHGTIPDAVSATRSGVFGFLTKPFDPPTLLEQVSAALQLSSASSDTDAAWRRDIVTCSPVMERLLADARLVAAGDASVCLSGASGTGKEMLAHAIHRASPRAAKPFLAVNCGAIPESLLESELFGHRRGSFTGATSDHTGLFRAADDGTLLLDEIGDMPTTLQVKLLRVLQDMQVRPVGAETAIAVDVRIISATHRDLKSEIAANKFREDLYYRLNVVSLHVPALAERREDIPLLSRHFLKHLAQRYGKEINGFAPEAMDLLVAAPWPGNVRQLLNVIEQVVALSNVALIPASLIGKAIDSEAGVMTSLDEARRQFERDYLVQLLKISEGSVTEAARLAKRNRTDFYKLLSRHSLDAASFKPGKAKPPL